MESEIGAGCALSLPFVDAMACCAGVDIVSLLDDGLSTTPSSMKPPTVAERFLVMLMMFGADVDGAGVANVTLPVILAVPRGLRVGRGSSLVGPYSCAEIIASNLRMSDAMPP